jgi:hypothetical protein
MIGSSCCSHAARTRQAWRRWISLGPMRWTRLSITTQTAQTTVTHRRCSGGKNKCPRDTARQRALPLLILPVAWSISEQSMPSTGRYPSNAACDPLPIGRLAIYQRIAAWIHRYAMYHRPLACCPSRCGNGIPAETGPAESHRSFYRGSRGGTGCTLFNHTGP